MQTAYVSSWLCIFTRDRTGQFNGHRKSFIEAGSERVAEVYIDCLRLESCITQSPSSAQFNSGRLCMQTAYVSIWLCICTRCRTGHFNGHSKSFIEAGSERVAEVYIDCLRLESCITQSPSSVTHD